MLYSSREEMEQFVRLVSIQMLTSSTLHFQMYPNNLMVFENPGVFIFIVHNYRTLIETLLLCIILSSVLVSSSNGFSSQIHEFQFNAIMYTFISREIRLGIISNSSKHLEERRRLLKNLSIQVREQLCNGQMNCSFRACPLLFSSQYPLF